VVTFSTQPNEVPLYQKESPLLFGGKNVRDAAVSTRGYYRWLPRPKSSRTRQKEKLHDDEKWKSISRSGVAREMQAMSLRCRTKKRFVVTTDSKHSMPVAPNLLNRDFEQEYPNRAWVSDSTCLPVKNRWMYLVVFIDIFHRKVVVWYLSDSVEAESSITALNRAY
jgi:transposase InsO family protein